jgi:tripartite-type tricarboxylate transporter receptor subunit TctC
MKRAFTTVLTAAVVAAAAVTGSRAGAQPAAEQLPGYPAKPIHLIAPEVPGSSTDLLARILAAKLGDAMGQRIEVDNIFGDAGIEAGVKAPPNGLTLVYGSAGTLAVLPHVKKVSFDPLNDLMPVGRFVISPTLLAVHPSLPAANVKELIALMKSRPNTLRMATAGFGTAGHFSGVMFASMAGVSPVVVHYNGGGPAIEAVVHNDAQWTFSPIAGRLPRVRTGELRALATGGSTRLAVLPDVPTVAEAGIPGYNSVGWGGIFVPKGTPRPIIDRLNAAIVKALAAPELKDQFARQGSEPAASTVEELQRLLREDYDRLGQVAKSIGMLVQ